MQLAEVLQHLGAMPAAKRAKAEDEAVALTRHMRWVPNPGPQTQAYLSKADILLYGGEPGGGKSSLLLGLAFNCHQRSLIMRRQYANIGPLTDEALKIHGTREGYNGSPPPKLRISDRQVIEFGAAANAGDEQNWQGNPHDFIGFDEGTQFLRQQVRFLMGWLRSTDPAQRTRIVIATNPPLDPDGLWVVEMFSPWLDERHPNPAKPGELRWYITDAEGEDREVDGPEPVDVAGKIVRPLSRTFIPASVADNPYLGGTDYQSKLDAMIEPFRSILLGGFKASIKDDPFQVIPTTWVQAAQDRWTPRPPAGLPMCAIGVDPVGGGKDKLTIAPRHDWWYAPLTCIPGKEITLGSQIAGHVISIRRDNATIVLDMGGGYGGGAFQTFHENGIEVQTHKGAGKSMKRTADRKLGFVNKRSEVYWLFREALDPDQIGGSPVALPPDPELVSDLTKPTFRVTPNGIEVQPKEQVVKLLGRSPDRGDAVVMSWSGGQHGVVPTMGPGQYGREQWVPPAGHGRNRAQMPVNLGSRHQKTSRHRS